MPEEPQNVDQNQPLAQPLPQPQPQPQPQTQPQPQPDVVSFNPEQPVAPIISENPVVESNPQPANPPVNNNSMPAEPVQTTYAPQPQFEPNQQATAPVGTPAEPTIVNPMFSQSQPVTVVKKSKKGIIIAAVAAGILLTVGGGSALAYNLWYSNPEKVISDAIIKAITAKNPVYNGKFTSESDYFKASVEITAKQLDATGSLDAKVSLTYEGKDFILTGGAIFDKAGDLYFKVSGIKTTLEEYAAASRMVISELDEFIAKVDNKWVKISNEDLRDFNKSLATSKSCFDDTINKYKSDNSALTEISDLYSKNPFIKINRELAQKNGSFGYEIEPDYTKAKLFFEGFVDTKIYTEIHSCDSSFDIDPEDIIPTETSGDNADKLELWVNSWSHEITEIKATSSKSSYNQYEISIKPLYNQDIKINTPTSSISLDEFVTAVENMLESAKPDPDYDPYDYDYSDQSYSLSQIKNNLLSKKLE